MECGHLPWLASGGNPLRLRPLLVSQRQPRLEQFLRRPGDEWTLRTAEGRDAALLLPALGVTLALREVFAGVEFPPASFRPPTPPRG